MKYVVHYINCNSKSFTPMWEPQPPIPPQITMDQDALMTATCCMLHCILSWLFLAAPRSEAKHLQASLLFFLGAGFGMEFLCEDCCLYRVRAPVSGCLWLPVNPKSCAPLRCLCKAKNLDKRPWQLPSPFLAYSFGPKIVNQFIFLTCTFLLFLRYAVCMFDAIAI